MITEKEPLMELVRQLTGVLEKMDLKDSSRNEILKIKMGLQAILQENKVSDISAEEYINKKQLQFNTYTSEGVITKQGLIKHLKEYASIVDERKDNIPANFKQVTGHNSPKEMAAYEKGREDEQKVCADWIEKWNGNTHSVMGALLQKKFDEKKDVKPFAVKELQEVLNLDSQINSCRIVYDDTSYKKIQRLFWEAVDAIQKKIDKRKDNVQVLCAICGKSITETGTAYKGKPVHIGCYHKAKNERKDSAGSDAIEFAEFLGEQNRICFLGADNVRRWHKLIGGTPLTTEELYKIFKIDHS